MKKIYNYIAAVALVALTSSCTETIEEIGAGTGTLTLTTKVSTDVEIESRATDGLAESCMVWISNEKGLVRRYNKLADVPPTIDLVSGSYIAEAWAGDSVPMTFDADKRYFKGSTAFEIKNAQNTDVTVNCKIANVVVKVVYDKEISKALSEYEMVIGHQRGSLVYDQTAPDANGNLATPDGYFMMPSTDKNIKYTISGKRPDGTAFTKSAVIENAKPAHKYIINVKTGEGGTASQGGALITFTVDEYISQETVEKEILGAPSFSVFGQDAVPVVFKGAKGSFGRQVVYVASPLNLTSLLVESDSFTTTLPALGGNDIDFITVEASSQLVTKVANAGLSCIDKSADVSGGSLYQINFESAFTDAIDDGEYVINISATDEKGRTNSTSLTFIVSDDPVAIVEPLSTDADYSSVVLRGEVAKEGVESVGFKYRTAGQTDFTYVDGVVSRAAFAKGDKFTYTLTGLKDGITIEYRAVSGDFEGAIHTIATKAYPQLPNAGFEDWQDSSAPYLVYASGQDMFWDTGNHGSSTMGKNVTVPDTQYKHSGNRSIKLASQFVGVGLIGKFAAGNLFTGKYLKTDGTDGILGWGRPWEVKPKALKGWVKYSPVAITHSSSDAPAGFSKGEMDQGIIYVALLSGDNFQNPDSSYPDYPIIIKTKTKELFNKAASNVIAYGEKIFTEATPGNGMIEFEIPLNDVNPGTVKYIQITASASFAGDYFTGGDGSTMWLDDLQLVY